MSKSSSSQSSLFIPTKIVSGGQTGVDRAALEVAIALGIQHGGWCPAGRLAEDGSVPSRYQMMETESAEYPVRTEQNVIASDATLILYEGKLKGGTLLTRRVCRRLSKAHLCTRFDDHTVEDVRQWLQETKPQTLNIAGPRESTSPGIFDRSLQFLLAVFAG